MGWKDPKMKKAYDKAYYKANRIKLIENAKLYEKANVEVLREKRRLRYLANGKNPERSKKRKEYDKVYGKKRRSRPEYKAYQKEYGRNYARKRSKTPTGKYSMYKSKAKSVGKEFTLSYEEFVALISSPCHYCGYNEGLIGIDRRDNEIGYALPNCLSCCWPCNKFKKDRDYTEFLDRCRKIVSKHPYEPIE